MNCLAPCPRREGLPRAAGVTLVCVDCVHPTLAACALDYSRRTLEFDRVLLLSDEPPDVLPEGIDWVRIPELSFKGYQRFKLRDLLRYTYTPYVLSIETDGWILKPERWNPDWLKWDYIGAPWPEEKYSQKTRVGNSGCCLRSRRLLAETARLATPERIKRHLNFHLLVDTFTCYDLYEDLTAAGMRFAPPEVAAEFAFETPTEWASDSNEAFGYHGKDAPATLAMQREMPRWARRTEWRNAGGRLRVIVNPYAAATTERQVELDDCLRALRENRQVDELIEIPGRLMFCEYFARANQDAGENDVTVLLNSDCHLDSTAANLGLLKPGEFWCLTRHEMDGGQWRIWNVPYSQDAWAWRGQCRLTRCGFLPGTMGCDNVLAYRAFDAGYRVRNPAKSVRVCHRHAGEQRTALKRLSGPYLTIWPHDLDQHPNWEIDLYPKMPNEPAVWRPGE